MWALDDSILADSARLTAVMRAQHSLTSQQAASGPVMRLAALSTDAPAAAVTVVDQREEHVLGIHGAFEFLSRDRRPVTESLGALVVCAGAALSWDGTGREFARHPAVTHEGVRAFLGVPLCDGSGLPVGALTVLDTRRRPWSGQHLGVLEAAAELLPVGRPAVPEVLARTRLDSGALLDSIQEAFLAVGRDGVIRDCNPAAERLLGFTGAELRGRHLTDTLLPDYRGEPIGAALDRLFTGGSHRPVQREVSVRHRDGSRLATRAALSVIPAAGGAVACVFLTDLSLRAAAQQAADHSDGFLRALLDSLSVGVMACDDTGRVIVMNSALRRVQGLSETAELPANLPARLSGVLHDARLQPMEWEQTPLMRAWRGEHVEDVDVMTASPGHRIRTFASAAQPITAPDGRRLGAVAVAHEVTMMRRIEGFRECHLKVETALKNAESVRDAAPAVTEAVATTLGWPFVELFLTEDGVGTLSPVGHWSTSGAEPDAFFGHRPVRGQGVTGQVWQSGKAMWVSDIAHSFQSGTAWEKERVQICVSHGIHTVLAVPVRESGTLLGVLTCYADAPEVHEDLLTVLLDGVAAQLGVYVALRRAEELTRQLARAQDDFLDLVGHELRTPLTSIAANAAMLGEESSGLDDDNRQMVDAVLRNTAALQHLVDTLLDLAALESGHDHLSIELVDLVEIVSAAVGPMRLVAANAGVRLSADVPERLPVHGDARRLRQVVDDLLSNAVKYSPAGAEVSVSVQVDGQAALLEIIDTGIGTPTREQSWVFNRFFRASNVRHQGTPGSGLGLSLARAIVRLHGGEISLGHHEPTGTTVCVRLPLAATQDDPFD